MSDNKKSEILIKVETDENAVPEKLSWHASDNNGGGEIKALLMTVWDPENRNSMRIDLWTKEMTVDEMKYLFHQNIMTMSETFERATGEKEMALAMRDFGNFFAEKMGIKPPTA